MKKKNNSKKYFEFFPKLSFLQSFWLFGVIVSPTGWIAAGRGFTTGLGAPAGVRLGKKLPPSYFKFDLKHGGVVGRFQ